MKQLSLGEASTLGNWYKLCKLTFGEDSAATKFIKDKMDEQGKDEEVIADEAQLLHILMQMHVIELEGK